MAANQPIIIKKKKGHGHGGHHGGSWKVAYADFVTAMMAFFMVMWIMGMSEETKDSIQGYFNDPMGFGKNPPKAPMNLLPATAGGYTVDQNREGRGDKELATERKVAMAVRDDLEAAIINNADKEVQGLFGSVKVNVTNEGLEVEMVETSGAVFFETGSAKIRPGAKKLLKNIAPIFRKARRPILVDGHTDAKPYRRADGYDNWGLSTDRARALMRALIEAGVSERQFVAVRGFAATRLKKPEEPFHFSNRRVTVLLPFDRYGGNDTRSLPADILRDEIEGVFKKPVEVKP